MKWFILFTPYSQSVRYIHFKKIIILWYKCITRYYNIWQSIKRNTVQLWDTPRLFSSLFTNKAINFSFHSNVDISNWIVPFNLHRGEENADFGHEMLFLIQVIRCEGDHFLRTMSKLDSVLLGLASLIVNEFMIKMRSYMHKKFK